MNLENFHRFLSEPANLHRVSYNELKSLVAEYPFSANLRILLLMKSKLEKNPELAYNLKLASAYSVNRTFLYEIMHNPKLLHALQEEEVLEHEDVLELKDLTEVKDLLKREEKEKTEIENLIVREIPEPVKPKPETGTQNWAKDLFLDADAEFESKTSFISIDSLLNSLSDKEQAEGDPDFENEEEDETEVKVRDFTVENLSGFSAMLDEYDLTSDTLPLEVENELPQKNRFTPMPKDSFSSWLIQLEKDLNRELEVPDINKHLDEIEETKLIKIIEEPVAPSSGDEEQEQEKPEKSKKFKAKQFAEKSLSLNREIVSETLANLLVKQERYEKAIEMYEKLSLKYPDKKAIFAAQIDKLKNF